MPMGPSLRPFRTIFSKSLLLDRLFAAIATGAVSAHAEKLNSLAFGSLHISQFSRFPAFRRVFLVHLHLVSRRITHAGSILRASSMSPMEVSSKFPLTTSNFSARSLRGPLAC